MAIAVLLWTAVAVFSTGDAPAERSLSARERQIIELTNKARAEHDLPPLHPQGTLMQVARAHSKNMARHEKMAHELDGKNPAKRVQEAGYPYRAMGENVAYGTGQPSVDEIFRGWMKSPGHRANILSSKFDEIGVGIARSGQGSTYFTQVFGSRRGR